MLTSTTEQAKKKGPDHYGPVLFVFDLDVLLGLPGGTNIEVTKKNPVNWRGNEQQGDRWFPSPGELAASIHFGDFDKILVIQTPSGKLDFPGRQARIILDNPQRKVSAGEDACTRARNRLTEAAAVGKINAAIAQRDCQNGCVCLDKYAVWNVQKIDSYFG